jgi:hypothetical protein
MILCVRSPLGRPPLSLLLHGTKLYWNDERTRCFCAALVWPTLQDSATVKEQLAGATPFSPFSASACSSPCCSLPDLGSSAAAHSLLLSLIAHLDAILLSFDQPAYYQPPELHATLAWRLPSEREASKTEGSHLRKEDVQSVVSPASPHQPGVSAAHPLSSPHTPSKAPIWLECECDRVLVTIGNRLYTLPLDGAAETGMRAGSASKC